jgi:hypothetical protein
VSTKRAVELAALRGQLAWATYHGSLSQIQLISLAIAGLVEL